MWRRRVRLVVLLLATFACAQLSDGKPPPKPNTYTGQFVISVRGYWSGQGTATVSKGTIQLVANVADDAGNAGTLVADYLPIVDNKFQGTGTVCGLDMKIVGRVEAQDPPPPAPAPGPGKGKKAKSKPSDQPVLLDARIGATFTAGPHGGRIAGSRGE